jgi:hypothetical protein
MKDILQNTQHHFQKQEQQRCKHHLKKQVRARKVTPLIASTIMNALKDL